MFGKLEELMSGDIASVVDWGVSTLFSRVRMRPEVENKIGTICLDINVLFSLKIAGNDEGTELVPNKYLSRLVRLANQDFQRESKESDEEVVDFSQFQFVLLVPRDKDGNILLDIAPELRHQLPKTEKELQEIMEYATYKDYFENAVMVDCEANEDGIVFNEDDLKTRVPGVELEKTLVIGKNPRLIEHAQQLGATTIRSYHECEIEDDEIDDFNLLMMSREDDHPLCVRLDLDASMINNVLSGHYKNRTLNPKIIKLLTELDEDLQKSFEVMTARQMKHDLPQASMVINNLIYYCYQIGNKYQLKSLKEVMTSCSTFVQHVLRTPHTCIKDNPDCLEVMANEVKLALTQELENGWVKEEKTGTERSKKLGEIKHFLQFHMPDFIKKVKESFLEVKKNDEKYETASTKVVEELSNSYNINVDLATVHYMPITPINGKRECKVERIYRQCARDSFKKPAIVLLIEDSETEVFLARERFSQKFKGLGVQLHVIQSHEEGQFELSSYKKLTQFMRDLYQLALTEKEESQNKRIKVQI